MMLSNAKAMNITAKKYGKVDSKDGDPEVLSSLPFKINILGYIPAVNVLHFAWVDCYLHAAFCCRAYVVFGIENC